MSRCFMRRNIYNINITNIINSSVMVQRSNIYTINFTNIINSTVMVRRLNIYIQK